MCLDGIYAGVTNIPTLDRTSLARFRTERCTDAETQVKNHAAVVLGHVTHPVHHARHVVNGVVRFHNISNIEKKPEL